MISKRPLGSGKVYCHRCHGHGRVLAGLANEKGPDGSATVWRECPVCLGVGQMDRERFGVRNREPAAPGELITEVPRTLRERAMFTAAARCEPFLEAVRAAASSVAANDEQPVRCWAAAAVDVEIKDAVERVPPEIMFMPAGVHEIVASRAGEPVRLKVLVDESAVGALNASLARHRTGKQRPFFDFDHADKGPASAWPLSFAWRQSPEPGVYASVEWSKAGAEAVQGKMYRTFSPAFFPDKQTPARVIGAPLNMGALVNDPAFKQISPLFAGSGIHHGGREGTEKAKMNDAELAAANERASALQASMAALEKENQELRAAQASSTHTAAIAAKDAEIAALKQTVTGLREAVKARAKADADAAVKAAVARGALPPKDEAVQAKWRGLIENDPANVALLAAIPSNPALKPVTVTSVTANGGAVTTNGGEASAEAFVEAVKARHAELKDRSKAIDAAIAGSPEAYKAWRDANGQPGLVFA